MPKFPPPAIKIPVVSIEPPVKIIDETFIVNVISIKDVGGAGQLPSVSQLPKQCNNVVSLVIVGKTLSL